MHKPVEDLNKIKCEKGSKDEKLQLSKVSVKYEMFEQHTT